MKFIYCFIAMLLTFGAAANDKSSTPKPETPRCEFYANGAIIPQRLLAVLSDASLESAMGVRRGSIFPQKRSLSIELWGKPLARGTYRTLMSDMNEGLIRVTIHGQRPLFEWGLHSTLPKDNINSKDTVLYFRCIQFFEKLRESDQAWATFKEVLSPTLFLQYGQDLGNEIPRRHLALEFHQHGSVTTDSTRLDYQLFLYDRGPAYWALGLPIKYIDKPEVPH